MILRYDRLWKNLIHFNLLAQKVDNLADYIEPGAAQIFYIKLRLFS